MAKYATLKAAIEEIITTNGNYEINGEDLRETLKEVVNSLGANYQFMGLATPETDPGTPDQNVAYLAGPGTYPNFGPTTVKPGEIGIFKYNGTWDVKVIQTDTTTNVININAIANHPAGYATPALALADVPERYRKLGCTVVYKDDTTEMWVMMICVDNFTIGDDWWTDFDNNWKWIGPVELRSTGYDENYVLNIGLNTDFHIIDNLESDTPYYVLSAKQGKLLKEKIEGWSQEIESIDTTGVQLPRPLLHGMIITKIEGATKLILVGQFEEVITPADLPYKMQHNAFSVKTESGTATDVTIGVRGVLSDDFINVNDYYGHSAAYASAQAARADVALTERKKGLYITYLLSVDANTTLWVTDQFIGSNISGWGTASNWKVIGPVSVLQNTITLEEWQPNTDYVVGNQVQTGLPTKYYRCVTAHTSGSSFDSTNWREITNFANDGYSITSINIGTEDRPMILNCVKLVGMGDTSSDAGATNVGDIFYNTDQHLLKKVTQITPSISTVTIPFYEGGIYTYDNMLYIWDGANLIRINAYDYPVVYTNVYTTYELPTIHLTTIGIFKEGVRNTYTINDDYTLEGGNMLLLNVDSGVCRVIPNRTDHDKKELVLLTRASTGEIVGGYLYADYINKNVTSGNIKNIIANPATTYDLPNVHIGSLTLMDLAGKRSIFVINDDFEMASSSWLVLELFSGTCYVKNDVYSNPNIGTSELILLSVNASLNAFNGGCLLPDYLNKRSNPLYGKKIVTTGVSTDYGSTITDPYTKTYTAKCAEFLKMSYVNYAIGGSCFSKGNADDYDGVYYSLADFQAATKDTSKKYFVKDGQIGEQRPWHIYHYDNGSWVIMGTTSTLNGRTPIVDRIDELDADADIVIVGGFATNDWAYRGDNYGAEYLNDGDSAVANPETAKLTLCGALHLICRNLMSKYQGKLVIFTKFGSAFRYQCDTSIPFDALTPNQDNLYGYTEQEYIDTIKTIINQYGFAWLDISETLGFTPYNYQWWCGDTTPNYIRVHPNATAHAMGGQVLASYLLNYYLSKAIK